MISDQENISQTASHSETTEPAMAEEIRTPDVLNLDYRYVKLLGEGANGRTWLAKDRRNALNVAIKELKFADDFKSMELFEREAEVLQSVNIPGVPKFYKSVSHDGISYIIQEYIPYPSLEVALTEGKTFSEAEVFTILKCVSDILYLLQTQYVPAIIHRDIKPGNILYKPASGEEAAQAWLIDFGSVDNAHKQSEGSTIAGTFGYMAPEQLQGEVSPRSDFYSLGATAVHLLTGVFPYEIPSELFKLQFRPVVAEKAPQTSNAMLDLLDKLLASEAENRPQNVVELKTLLNEAHEASLRYGKINQLVQDDDDMEPRTGLGLRIVQTKFGAGIWDKHKAVRRFFKAVKRKHLIKKMEKEAAREKAKREKMERALQIAREKRGVVYRCQVRRVSFNPRGFVNMLEGIFSPDGDWYAAYLSANTKRAIFKCTRDAPKNVKIHENTFEVVYVPGTVSGVDMDQYHFEDISIKNNQVVWLTPEFFDRMFPNGYTEPELII